MELVYNSEDDLRVALLDDDRNMANLSCEIVDLVKNVDLERTVHHIASEIGDHHREDLP